MKWFVSQICREAPGEGGGGGAPAAAPAAPAAPAASEPSTADIMQWDPFAPPSSEPVDPAGSAAPKTPAEAIPAGGANTPAATPPAAPGATPASAIPATPAVPPQAPNLEQLFREQTDLIRSAVARPAEPAAPTEPEKPRFNLAMPPQLLAGLRSEDPNEYATSVHSMINGIANHLWREMNAHIETNFRPSVQQQVQSYVDGLQVQQNVGKDFYGKHATLDNPTLKPIVQQAGAEVARARMAAGKSVNWSEELRDEIAEHVYKALPQLRPVVTSGPTPPTPPAGHKPRFAAGGGSPPAGPSGVNDEFGADLLTG